MIEDIREALGPRPWTFSEVDDPIVLDVVVREGGSDGDALAGAASGVVSALDAADDVDAILAWMRTPYRKVVRRANAARWRKLEDKFGDNKFGDVFVFGPAPKSVVRDRALRSCQVHTDFERTPSSSSPSGTHVDIVVIDSISTGKACAQCAHATQLIALTMSESDLRAWRHNDFAVSVERGVVDAAADVVVVDNGLTEVVPGTTTATANLRRF